MFLLVLYELVFNGLDGLYAESREFGHIPDAIPTFEQRYYLTIFLFALLDGLYAAFPSAKLSATIDVLLATAIKAILDIAALDV